MSREFMDDVEELRSRAVRCYEEGDYQAALERLNAALGLAPEFLYMIRALFHRELGLHQDAEQDFRSALSTCPPGNSIGLELGSQGLFHSLIDLDRADEALEEAARFFADKTAGDSPVYFRAMESVRRLRATRSAREIREALAADG